ncbi:VOC family protein [Enterococcus sp. AZ196]|uniref:VOC family protein n=1 Tax=Enterococcus sp. AZ196 TaxID=2774659 RepID=UPI003D2D17B9
MNNFDNFFLPTTNLRESKDFYEKIGLNEKFNFSDRGMVAFSLKNEEPAIILKDVSKFPDQKSTIWFVVDDTYKEYQRLKTEGITFLSEPFKIGTGVSVEFEDPSGNRLGITDYSVD